MNKPNFELPKNIERYLHMLSKLYARNGQKQLQEIIVNSQLRIHEEFTYDNWNGETYGHALYFVVPEFLYPSLSKQRKNLQNQITKDINEVHNVPGEHIAEVFLEMGIAEEQDWRKESGLLLTGKRVIQPEAADRIWGSNNYRLFLSHKAEVKGKAVDLKEKLKPYGISCFVAHEDIHPTKEWQNEIEKALFSMDALVALITEQFHGSFWTDQEVGCALGRDVPIIPVKMEKDPCGLIGKFQALSCGWDAVAKEIVKILIKNNRMLNAYILAVQDCQNYDRGNILSEILPYIEKLSDQQANNLMSAFNENRGVHDSFGFNGKGSCKYGKGLVFYLNRVAGNTYSFSRSGKIIVVSP